MQLTVNIALEVAAHEALIRQTYKDSVGVKTWCVGMTDATGHDVSRYIGNPASLQHCMNIFIWALDNYADAVRETFEGHDLTEAQFAAALSFHWNTGAIKRATWVKQWKAGQVEAARRSFMNWKSPPEIIKRRDKERNTFFDGVWYNDGKMLEFTRVTKRMTPDWGSGKMVDVTDQIEDALDLQYGFMPDDPVASDHTPEPDADVVAPTLSKESAPRGGLLAALIRILVEWLEKKG